MKYSEEFLDNIAVLGFLLTILNYEENLEQSDNDDIMDKMDNVTHSMMLEFKKDLAVQNTMLEDILKGVRK